MIPWNHRVSAAVVYILIFSAAFQGRLKAQDPTAPQLVALPQSVPDPEGNATNNDKVRLGKQLFFDPRLSGDNSISCATCHLPEHAFADRRPLSQGAGGQELTRHTPSLLNVGFFETLTWDGKASSLEEQALQPIEAANEMNQDLDELVEELAAVPGYAKDFQRVFGKPVDRQSIAEALAAFQRTLVARNSPFDRYLSGDRSALTPAAKEGLRLFRGEAGCIECHHGPLLSDNQFYRLGVGRNDEGRARVSGKETDRYRFRTPSLRNVADSGPYMHDGSFSSLYDVVQFYYRDMPAAGPDGLELDTQALTSRSFSEIDAIVEFLKSLSGELPKITRPELP